MVSLCKIYETLSHVGMFHRINIGIFHLTRGPLGHLLDTAVRCLKAKRVGTTMAEKMAVEKLQSVSLNVSLK